MNDTLFQIFVFGFSNIELYNRPVAFYRIRIVIGPLKSNCAFWHFNEFDKDCNNDATDKFDSYMRLAEDI